MSDNARRTVASIFYEARQAGWIDPSRGESDWADVAGDISNSRRFADEYRDKLIYVSADKKWFSYVQGSWAQDRSGEVIRAAKSVADKLVLETAAAHSADPTDAKRKRVAGAVSLHGNSRRLDAMIALAAAEPGMGVPDRSFFDRDPMLLGVPGGVVDLRTGRLVEPSPRLMISRTTGVNFDPAARCPRWENTLLEIFGGSELVDFVRRSVGYTLSGLVDEEVLFYAYGAGANGKSVFANVISSVFGSYAVTIGSEVLAKTKHNTEADRGKVRLPGSRLALVNEVGQGDIWNDQRIKEIVSRERIAARLLFGEAFDFYPTHALWVRGNHLPAVLDTGDGMWRRIIVLPFSRQFAPEERIPDLDRTLIEEEGAGILNWMLRGFREYRQGGLQVPPQVKQLVAKYREDSDVAGDWLANCCEPEPASRVLTGELHGSYQEYLAEMGIHPKTRPAFVRMMTQRGFDRKRSNGQDFILGIRLCERER